MRLSLMILRLNIFGWLLFGAILLFGAQASNADVIFKSIKWHNRVLVLSVGEDVGEVEEQISLLESFAADIETRELIVLRLNTKVLERVPELSPFPFQTQILESRQERRYYDDLFKSDINELRVSLVGLDGEMKQQWDGVVAPQDVFDMIDETPVDEKK